MRINRLNLIFIHILPEDMNNATANTLFLPENTTRTKPRYWVIAPFIILILTTCLANIVVVIVTSMDIKLKGVTYMYVTSLALADFMVCTHIILKV